MGERVLKDGSIDYSQGVIGPSLSDRNLAKRSEGSSPGNFSARNNFHVSDLAPIAITAPLVLAGCEISIGGENREIKTESLSQHFDSFLQENGGKPNRQLMTLWTESLGIPYEAVWQLDDHPLDVLDSPDIETLNYFQIILKGNGLPTKGDIVITEGTDNYRNGRSGIATEDVGQGNDGKLYEKALATDQSSGYPLLFQFPLDGIAGWLKPTEFIRPEMPNEVAEVSDNMSVSELFDAFYYKYDRLYVEAEDDSPEGKFSPSDLIMAWVDTLGIPRETVKYETIDQILSERKDITDKYFEFIEYQEGGGLLPKKGDIVVFDYADDSDDRMAIATGEGKVEEYAGVFTQGYSPGNPSFKLFYSIGQISGWLTPRNLPGSENSDTQVAEENVIDGESQEGQVLGAESKKSLDELFDNFVKENEGVHGDRAPILIWLDTLGIPEETITEGYNAAGDLLDNPTTITEQSFDVILKTGDNKPKKGDIIILPPIEGDGVGEIGIATGETIENDWQGVFTTSATLDKFSYNQISGWLRPKGLDESTGETESAGGEVLGVNTKSMYEIYKTFFEKYNGQGVETSDPSNFRQCVDLIWAWLDEMKIPRDSIRNFDPDHPYASQIYTNANDETRKNFEVIPYEDGMKLQLGDIVVWGEEVGTVAGHVAIATGEENLYFSQNYPLEQNPENRIAHLQEISAKGIIGVLRPKGVETEEKTPEPRGGLIEFPEFDGDPLEKARYGFITEVFNRFNIPREYIDYGNTIQVNQWIDASAEELIELAERLARGEKVELEEPLKFYWIYKGANAGVAYLNNIQVDPGDYSSSPARITDADMANGILWKGNMKLSGIMKFATEEVGPEVENFDFSRLQIFTSWMDYESYEAYTIAGKTHTTSYVNYCDRPYGSTDESCMGGTFFIDAAWDLIVERSGEWRKAWTP